MNTSGPLEKTPYILVVDDDASWRTLMRVALERDGYVVHEATDGAEAIDAARRTKADLILMDGAMPGVDGFAACSALRKQADLCKTPILMITMFDDERSVERAFTAGATDYITKPVNWAVLRSRVRRLISEKNGGKHLVAAQHDALTALPDRSLFLDRLGYMLARSRRTNEIFGLAFVDLDDFKLVNDSYGHEFGDRVLRELAERLLASVRESDTVARFGGDEFTLLLHGVGSEHDVSIALQRVIQRIAQPFKVDEREVTITCSIGVALYPTDGEDPKTLLRHADAAMYRAKEQGRNQYHFYTAAMGAKTRLRLTMRKNLQQALEREEFVLYYQPIVSIKERRAVGAEALLYWKDPTLGTVPPTEFLSLADEIGMIDALGAWMLRSACRQGTAWRDRRLRLTVSLSRKQLLQHDLVRRTKQILEDTGLPPSALDIDLAERALLESSERRLPVVQELKSLGVGLWVDEFGAGYSSITHLKRLPVDGVRLGAALVAGIPGQEEYTAVAAAMLAVAASLKLQAAAKNVETPAQLEFLRTHGCELVQGAYLGAPVPADELPPLIDSKRIAALLDQAAG